MWYTKTYVKVQAIQETHFCPVRVIQTLCINAKVIAISTMPASLNEIKEFPKIKRNSAEKYADKGVCTILKSEYGNLPLDILIAKL